MMIWKVDDSVFEGWGQEHWEPQDFDPVARIDGSARRIGQVLFHPTAEHVLATASGDHVVKLWDLGSTESPKAVLGGHGDAIQSMTFNPVGNVMITTCRDRKVRMFDPRTGADAVRVAEGHGGIKGARVTWMGEKNTFATTGFSRMSDRQVGIWDAGGMNNLKMTTLDQTSGVVMPFWSDNNILFLGTRCFSSWHAHIYLFYSWQGVSHFLVNFFRLLTVAEMEMFDTTSGSLIRCSLFPSSRAVIPNVECASSHDGLLTSPSAKLLELIRSLEPALSQSHSLSPVKWVLQPFHN